MCNLRPLLIRNVPAATPRTSRQIPMLQWFIQADFHLLNVSSLSDTALWSYRKTEGAERGISSCNAPQCQCGGGGLLTGWCQNTPVAPTLDVDTLMLGFQEKNQMLGKYWSSQESWKTSCARWHADTSWPGWRCAPAAPLSKSPFLTTSAAVQPLPGPPHLE